MSAPPSVKPPASETPRGPWRTFGAACGRSFRDYAAWLTRLGWGRFLLLSVLLLLATGLLQVLPPFSWTIHERLVLPEPDTEPGGTPPRRGVQIRIGDGSVVVRPGDATADAAASAASASAHAADVARRALEAAEAAASALRLAVPPGSSADAVHDIVEEARRDVEAAIRDAKRDVENAARDAAEARREVAGALPPLPREPEVERVKLGDPLPEVAFLWIVASAILKLTYQGRVRAEAQAAQATETAEAEALRRQVVEARMAAMQAQVEPHFLFNTLAAIDHLIETDAPRASRMQKNLIALLRASMPSMRDSVPGGVRDLGRELDVVRPYLEILQVRMEERLVSRIDVPEGLRSAAFPPMMLQSLVENAVRHGLEPKPEGGMLTVRAEVAHGRLAVTVRDTGVGFGRAATGGTGVGLANIRERLKLLYGDRAALQVLEPADGGTSVTITVPYTVYDDARGV